MRQFAEIIERTTHIDLFPRLHVKKRKVYGASSAVAGLFCYISLIEHGNPVIESQSLLLVMRDIDGCNPEIFLHLLQLIAKLNAKLCVKV